MYECGVFASRLCVKTKNWTKIDWAPRCQASTLAPSQNLNFAIQMRMHMHWSSALASANFKIRVLGHVFSTHAPVERSCACCCWKLGFWALVPPRRLWARAQCLCSRRTPLYKQLSTHVMWAAGGMFWLVSVLTLIIYLLVWLSLIVVTCKLAIFWLVMFFIIYVGMYL